MAAADESYMRPDVEQPTLLIIDDDPSILLLIDEVASHLGFRVKAVSSGLQGLEEMRDGLRPAVILLDIMMKRIDGLTFLAHMREIPEAAATPVIVMSTESVLDRISPRVEVSGALIKPFTIEGLSAALEPYRT